MGKFIIEGEHRLSGRVKVQGAKNAALPVLAATVMSRGEMTLFNCPEIRDVHNMLSILRELGVESYYDGDALKISGRNARSSPMPQRLSKELRSSIFMLGPLLSRFGEAVCAYPGGCEIGHRPVDLHLKGLAALGADIREERGYIICDGHNMHGGEIHLDYPSVGATENIMMAAAAVPGDTVITNSAREPEIEELQNFLNSIGGDIRGAGTSTIYIKGGMEEVPAAAHRIMPDRIAAGTLMCAVAMAGGEAELTDVCPEHIGSLISKLREAGCHISCGRDTLEIRAKERPEEIKLIETLPYPGFPTDMQAQIFALCTVADGTSVIVENLFENRFRHCAELIKMGANIQGQRQRHKSLSKTDRLHPCKNSYILIRKFDLERYQRKGAGSLRAGGKDPAQNISDRRCGSCGGAGKSNALKQVFADMDLMTDGAVCAGTVMAGFRCDIGNRGQHNKCQHYGQQARHKTKFLCHGLPSFAIL